jgi:oligosaccharide repeat unit polymerase
MISIVIMGVILFFGVSGTVYPNMGFILTLIVIGLLIILRLDYMNPIWAFCIPWLLVCFFATSEISKFSRPIANSTAFYMVFGLSLALMLATLKWPERRRSRTAGTVVSLARLEMVLQYATLIYVGITVLEIAVSGYVPLLQGLSGGQFDYLDFGIRSVHGLANALACAIFTSSVYGFTISRRRSFLVAAAIVIFCFILLFTRQNLVTLAVQGSVLFFLYRGRIRVWKLSLGLIVALSLFSVAGQLRSGDITDLAGIKPQYQWIPTPFIWLFAYSYFNVLNFDNTLNQLGAPYFDGSSLSSIIPSQLRPTTVSNKVLEVSNFNVTGYYTSVAADGGAVETIVLLAFFLSMAAMAYKSAERSFGYLAACSYSVLYFCSLFSFFINFWLYLPIIFQIAFFWIFDKLVSRPATLADRDEPVPGTALDGAAPVNGLFR